ITVDGHAIQQRPFDDMQRALRLQARVFGLLDDELSDAVYERVRQTLLHRLLTPRQILRRIALLAAALTLPGVLQQALGRVAAPVQQHVLNPLPQFWLYLVVKRQPACTADAPVQAGADGVIREPGQPRLG